MGKTKYNKDWENEFPWLSPHNGDPSSAYCNVCYKPFKIDNQGVGQVKSHAKSHENNPVKKAALEKFLAQPNRKLTSGSGGQLKLTKNNSGWTNSEKITVAEVIDALHLVQYNQSFSSVNGNRERYQRMFGADNPVAMGYSMGETKVCYIIKFGLAHYLKKQLMDWCTFFLLIRRNHHKSSQKAIRWIHIVLVKEAPTHCTFVCWVEICWSL